MVSKTEGKEWKAEFYTATGLSFSKTFKTKLEATNYERYLESTFGCAQERVKEVRKVNTKPFTRHGCKLQQAATGVRCIGLKMGCAHYDECLYESAKRGWYGWSCEKGKFTYLRKKEVVED